MIGAQSPSDAPALIQISLHDSAIIAPALYACGLTHATVRTPSSLSRMISREMSMALTTAPPGVSISKMILPAPLSRAAVTRRSMLRSMMLSMSPRIGTTAASPDSTGFWASSGPAAISSAAAPMTASTPRRRVTAPRPYPVCPLRRIATTSPPGHAYSRRRLSPRRSAAASARPARLTPHVHAKCAAHSAHGPL